MALPFPPGHFYSPIVNIDDVKKYEEKIWPQMPVILGIDFNDTSHLEFLTDIFPRFIGDYDYPERLEESADLNAFYTQNSQFSWLDSRTLFVLMRKLQPRRIIEVGSGFSSLLMADVNRRWLDGSCEITCIEPYPRPFLAKGIDGIAKLIDLPVQEVSLDVFSALEAGDILFIDSSHVAKTGSDVNHVFFEILPRLKPGVMVHIHDIFLPHDYPKEWAIGDNRSWNEQYVLRALLMFSSAFTVVFGGSYALWRFPARVADALALGGRVFGGASLWLRRN